MSQGGALMRPSEWLLVALSTIKSQSNTLTVQPRRKGGTRKLNDRSFLYSRKYGKETSIHERRGPENSRFCLWEERQN